MYILFCQTLWEQNVFTIMWILMKKKQKEKLSKINKVVIFFSEVD